ncbi:MAG TPA: hypothetical protein VGO98_03330 [Candidatus Saccharimonadales bacterium]|nr:hypothetical protein [Candidatus Saccharimonadales bacterium]
MPLPVMPEEAPSFFSAQPATSRQFENEFVESDGSVTIAEPDDDTISGRRPIVGRIFEPWSDKPAWYLASRPPRPSIRTILWALYGFLQLYRLSWVPVPRYWGSTRRRTKENYAFIYEHEDQSMGIFSAISAKGGALKTSIITWMAATFGYHTKGISIVFDADSGALESAAKRLEASVDPKKESLTAKNAANLLLYGDWIPDYQELQQFAPRSTESGVYVMSMKGITQWSARSTAQILSGHKRACGSLFVDTGPGEKESNTPGVVGKSTVVIVSGIHKNVSTDDAVMVTLDTPKYNLRKSGKHVLIAIGAVSWRNFNRRTQYELAEQFKVKPEQVILLPDHKRILKGDTVRLRKISKKFLYAMSVLNRVRVEAAIEYNRLHPMTFPSKVKSLTLQEQKEAAADRILSLAGGDVNRACEFLLDFAEHNN